MSCDESLVKVNISKFNSDEPRSAKTAEEKQLNNFELLSAIFVDVNYNGKDFIMTDVFFSDDIVKDKEMICLEFNRCDVGEKIMIVYTDIFGNDLTECYEVR